MKIKRAILAGLLVWTLIFISFTIMSFIEPLKDAPILQNLILFVLLLPIVNLAARYYYAKGQATNAWSLGMIIIVVCLILDALITLPLVIIPHGGSYFSFYTDPMLLIMGLEIMLIGFLYWTTKEKKLPVLK